MNQPKDSAIPELTVLITSFNARCTIESCLDSLRKQRTDRRHEIILVDSGTDQTAEFVADRYPEVRLLHFPHRLYCGDGRNRGISEARAPLVAFLDADCIVRESWIEAICEAHHQPNLAVAGSVHNGSRSLASWAYYFCEFNLWIPAQAAHQIREAAGCALSIKRAAFDRFGPFPEGSYCSDTAFHWRMRAAGERVLFWPSIDVYHTYPMGWGPMLRHISEHRRHFAVMDSREHKWSRGHRLFFAATTPLLPFLLTLAVAWRLRHAPRLYMPLMKSALPTFLGFCARAWGQLIGYMTSVNAAP